MSETHILIRLLCMYFPWNLEFGPAGGGCLNPPPRTPLHLGAANIRQTTLSSPLSEYSVLSDKQNNSHNTELWICYTCFPPVFHTIRKCMLFLKLLPLIFPLCTKSLSRMFYRTQENECTSRSVVYGLRSKIPKSFPVNGYSSLVVLNQW
jgi:hypothetical protein